MRKNNLGYPGTRDTWGLNISHHVTWHSCDQVVLWLGEIGRLGSTWKVRRSGFIRCPLAFTIYWNLRNKGTLLIIKAPPICDTYIVLKKVTINPPPTEKSANFDSGTTSMDQVVPMIPPPLLSLFLTDANDHPGERWKGRNYTNWQKSLDIDVSF